MKMRPILMAAASLAALGIAGGAKATVYVSDPNLGDFASTSTTFATLSNYKNRTFGLPPAVDPTTFASLQTGDRVYSGGTLTGLPGKNWILATFSSAVPTIRVFPNIDHPIDAGFDEYEYMIEGSNNGTTWTPLFNATGASATAPFTLTSFTGTAPTRVDATDTTACSGGGADCVGYIATFTFSTPYKFYAFGASTLAANAGDAYYELSGVSAANAGGVAEPASWALLGLGLGVLGAGLRMRRSTSVATTA